MIKELIEKVKGGEELTEEEEKIIARADEEKEEETEEKMIDELAEKLLKKIQPEEKAIDEKKIEKEVYEKMSKEEKINKFFRAIVEGDSVALKAYLSAGSATGSYLVPRELNAEVLNFLKEESVMRANAYVKMNAPAIWDISAWATLPTAYFRSEATSKTVSSPTFSQQTLTPYSCSVVCYLTNEFLEDAEMDISTEITNAMKEALIVKEEEVFASGDGDGQPTGLESYYATYPAARKITASDYADLADRIIAADTRLQKRYRGAAKYYMSTDQLEMVRLLKDTNDRYLFQDDLTGEFVGRINGKPVEVNDNLTNIWYGDLNSYWIAQRGGISVAMSQDATITDGGSTLNMFQTNMTAFRVEERIDGELVNNRGLIAIEAGEAESS